MLLKNFKILSTSPLISRHLGCHYFLPPSLSFFPRFVRSFVLAVVVCTSVRPANVRPSVGRFRSGDRGKIPKPEGERSKSWLHARLTSCDVRGGAAALSIIIVVSQLPVASEWALNGLPESEDPEVKQKFPREGQTGSNGSVARVTAIESHNAAAPITRGNRSVGRAAV